MISSTVAPFIPTIYKLYSFNKSSTVPIPPVDEFSTGSIPYSISPSSTALNTSSNFSYDFASFIFLKYFSIASFPNEPGTP